jgi:RimJ/RimL family protein N-acetyltransferase
MTTGAPAMRVIVAGDLTLEPQREVHADQMFVVLSDPAIYQYENAPPPSRQWLRERFRRLESRTSADGSEIWLNWVIRTRSNALCGFVQATVRAGGVALVAYELASAYWGRGIARTAVAAMIEELVEVYGVRRLYAIAVRRNERSMRLLRRLGFAEATPEEYVQCPVDADEVLMARRVGPR